MKIEKGSEPGVIAVFVEGLEDTPGWIALNRKKQDALLTITSDVQQFRGMKQLGEFGELMKLTEAQQLLEGEEMQMRDYLGKLYPLDHQRTIQRKQEAFAELAATIPNPILKQITAVGQDVIGQFHRIATAALGDIRNAVRAMPLLPVNTEKEAAKYLEELNGKLLEERKQRRKKGLTKDLAMSEKMATNALIHFDREGGLKTSAERRQYLKRVIGWYMQTMAVGGSVTATRISIPDGIIIVRGRPKGSKNKQKEAA